MELTTVSILFLAQLVTLFGFVVVASARTRRDPKIGAAIFSERDSKGVKPVLFAVHVGLILISLRAEAFPAAHAVVALYGAFMLTWLAPGSGDYGIGDGGLYQGWVARRFEEFDEWRLSRDELRLRLGSDWMALAIPREKYGELRAVLSRRIPDREGSAP